MSRYKLIITLYDELEFKDREEAESAADDWATEIADEQQCMVASTQVDEVDEDG